MIGKGLVRKAGAAGVALGALGVATVFLGVAIYHLLSLVLVPAASAAITCALFAVVAVVVASAYLKRQEEVEEEAEAEPEGLGARAYMLFRQRPILGTVAALAGGWIFLRNPALASIVAAAFTERSHGGSRSSRRRRR